MIPCCQSESRQTCQIDYCCCSSRFWHCQMLQAVGWLKGKSKKDITTTTNICQVFSLFKIDAVTGLTNDNDKTRETGVRNFRPPRKLREEGGPRFESGVREMAICNGQCKWPPVGEWKNGTWPRTHRHNNLNFLLLHF